MERARDRWDEDSDETITLGSDATLDRLCEIASEGCWLCQADGLENEDE